MVSSYTREQLVHMNIILEVNDAVSPYCESPCNAFYGKFRNFINLLYSSDNPVSLCNDAILSATNLPDDAKEFVQNWLMRSLPAIQGAPDADTAFDTIVSSRITTRGELEPYIDKLTSIVESSQTKSDS